MAQGIAPPPVQRRWQRHRVHLGPRPASLSRESCRAPSAGKPFRSERLHAAACGVPLPSPIHLRPRRRIHVRPTRRPQLRGRRGPFYASDSSMRLGTALKMVSLETSGIPSRIAVAAIQRSALCSRCERAWPVAGAVCAQLGAYCHELGAGVDDLRALDLAVQHPCSLSYAARRARIVW